MAAPERPGENPHSSSNTESLRRTTVVWLCGGKEDVIATELGARLASLGLTIATSPESADWAVVILSPSLAAADPPELAAWIRDRGADTIAFAINSGDAEWLEDSEGFAADSSAVPQSVHDGIVSKPLIVDIRDADPKKIDRLARLIVAAVTTEPAAPPVRRSRRWTPWVLVLLFTAALALVSTSLMRGPDQGVPTTVTSQPPYSTSSSSPASSSSLTLTSQVTPTSRPSTTGGVTSTAPGNTTTVSATSVPPPGSSAPVTEPAVMAGDRSLRGIMVFLLVAAVLVVAGVGIWRLGKRAGGKASAIDPKAASPAAQAQVFVSHDMQADGRVAQRLVRRLQHHHLAAWTAQRNIYPGEQWIFAIERGLTSSRGALILLSRSALGSNWVKQEIQMIVNLAVDGKIYVIPIRLDHVEIPLVLRGYQVVTLSDFDRAAEELYRRFAEPTAP